MRRFSKQVEDVEDVGGRHTFYGPRGVILICRFTNRPDPGYVLPALPTTSTLLGNTWDALMRLYPDRIIHVALYPGIKKVNFLGIPEYS